jgi:starch synthase
MGDAEMIKSLSKISAKYPDKFKMINVFDDIIAHQLEAGSDLYLSLADFEHSGLNIMYSLNYGAIPVTYHKSGTLDFIIPYKDTNTGNSFVLNEATPTALLKAVKSAIAIYGKKAEWLVLAERAMGTTFSWKPIVTAYEEIYRQLTKE